MAGLNITGSESPPTRKKGRKHAGGRYQKHHAKHSRRGKSKR
jgi:hypothetical protein